MTRTPKTAASAKAQPVSPNNPCPFLRALVGHGLLPDDVAPIAEVARVVSRVAQAGEGKPTLPAVATAAVAAAANGLSPFTVARNVTGGLHLNALRDGPLDKHGVGSGVLDALGQVDAAALDRLATFASPKFPKTMVPKAKAGASKAPAKEASEPGLDAAELKQMMDANFERAKGRRRLVDRAMMDAEWPVLLKVLGKPGKGGRYLSVADVRRLVVDRQLPARMAERLGLAAG